MQIDRSKRVWMGVTLMGGLLALVVHRVTSEQPGSMDRAESANSDGPAEPSSLAEYGPGRSEHDSSERSDEVLPIASEPSAGRPVRAPVKGRDEPFALPDPEAPPGTRQLGEHAYQEALARTEPMPAQAAFRKTVDAFLEHNRALAEEQAKSEGLSVQEVEELTQFGFFVQQTQRWSDVEDILGRPIEADARRQADALMHDANAAFKFDMRRLVREGAPETERWKLIEQTRQRYLQSYFALTGMKEQQLDDLFARDWLREGSPGDVPPPEQRADRRGAGPAPSARPPARPLEAPGGQ